MPEPAPPAHGTHLVLVGLMGSGKTTVGRKVASLTGRRFVDADDAFEAATGRTIADWFAEEGEASFRAKEEAVLAEVLSAPDPLVVGAGGGVVISAANRERLRQPDVTVVYLHADPAFLASRVQAKPHRPLLQGDAREVLTGMYEARDPWYREVADLQVEVEPAHRAGSRPKWRLAEEIVQRLACAGPAPVQGASS